MVAGVLLVLAPAEMVVVHFQMLLLQLAQTINLVTAAQQEIATLPVSLRVGVQNMAVLAEV